MLVYGDRSAERDPHAMIAALRRALAGVSLIPFGIERHAALVGAFIQASGLVQGLADAAFEAAGYDAPSPEQDASMAVLMALAGGVNVSWRSGFADTSAPAPDSLDALAALPLPDRITVRQAEGYAFYALYPEAYADAASALAPAPDMKVIGLRSIGAGLSAIVAAALGAKAPVTVRPVGHPFARELSLSPKLAAALLDDPAARYAIVDEGPGLSGSSLNAVADWLDERGVGPERIAFFPGHGGDLGAKASERHRARWRHVDRRVEPFEALVLDTPVSAHRLIQWVEDLVGPPTGPLRDISGGGWRALNYADEADWPAVDTLQERRKYLMTAQTGTWLLKFSGIGQTGVDKLARAWSLANAGFAPQIAGLRHGFLVQAWTTAVPLDRASLSRERLVHHLGRYLGFRAQTFAAAPGDGATLSVLFEMAISNTREALGAHAAHRLASRFPDPNALQARVRPVQVDARLQTSKWLVSVDGAVLKADALDHAQAHDLVGAQDIAWDVAGAAVEFALDPTQGETLRQQTGQHAGYPISSDLVSFCIACYLAFQLGARAMAVDTHTQWPREQARLSRARDRYIENLTAYLA